VRVLIVHNHYRSANPSGEDHVVAQESALLRAAGHEVELCGAHSDDIGPMSLAAKALLPGRVVWSSSAKRLVAGRIEAFTPDVVHVHNVFPLLSPSVFESCRAAGVPLVLTVHNYKPMCASGDLLRNGVTCHDCLGRAPLPALRHGCYRGSRLATLPVATSLVVNRHRWLDAPARVIALSHAQRDLLVRHGADPAKVVVKPNFVERGPVRATGAPGGHVLSLGRLSAEKGLHVLMDAWDLATARSGGTTSLPLVIAGSGPLDADVRAWASARDDVRVLGQVSRSRGAQLVADARAVVMPSVWEETFGLVAIEAMAAGVPVLASAHGSFPSLVTDGVDGWLHRPGDALGLATHLRRAVDEPERLATMGAAALSTYSSRFTPQANLGQLVSIYEAAAGLGVADEVAR
jgi:glycosyltransferase involved in cell wall biosynthesis